MKKIFGSSVAAIAIMAASGAYAADLPVYVEPVEPAPVMAAAPLWTGFYVGAQVGVAFNHDDDSCFDGEVEEYDGSGDLDGGDLESIAPSGSQSASCEDFDDLFFSGKGAPDGDPFLGTESDDDDDLNFLVGAHVGADWQTGNFVFGALLEANWLHSDDVEASGSYDGDLYEYVNFGPEDFGGGFVLPNGLDGFIPGTGIATVDGVQVIEDNGYTAPGLDGVGSEELNVDPRVDYSYSVGGVDWYGTLRARAGYAMGRALLYATGGLSFGETGDSSYDVTEYYTGREVDAAGLDPDDFSFCDEADVVGTRDPGMVCSYSGDDDGGMSWGWALGAGVEVLATNNFSVGLEYLYVDLEDTDDMEFESVSGESLTFEGADNNFHTISVRASYRFGG